MLKFRRCQEGKVSFEGITCNTVLCSVQYNVQQNEKAYIKYIHEYIYLPEGLVQPECLYCFLRPECGDVHGGIGCLTASHKSENGKISQPQNIRSS